MHNAAFAELGIAGEWSYEAIELAPQDFEAGVRRLAAEGFAGANVTVPHKLAALELATAASEAARAIGAANTLSFGAGGAIAAENTDAPGLIAALPQPPSGRRALVLGAGGAGRAAVWALRDAGAEVHVWNRTAERAAALARELGAEHLEASAGLPLAGYELLVNTTAAGLEGSGDPSAAVAQLRPWESAPMGCMTGWSWSISYTDRQRPSSSAPLDEAARR
jgi:shikimate dehydrogenase